MACRHGDRGFTLSEVLVALSVSALLFTSTFAIYVMASKFYSTNILGQNLQSDANGVIVKIIKGENEPGGIFRLSEAVTYDLVSISELHFTGTDGTERWYELSADGKSVIYHHPTEAGTVDETIYTAGDDTALTLRFWQPSGAIYSGVNIGIDVGLQQTTSGRTMTGSASSMIGIRNHSV